jgi:hypothetical protein
MASLPFRMNRIIAFPLIVSKKQRNAFHEPKRWLTEKSFLTTEICVVVPSPHISCFMKQ